MDAVVAPAHGIYRGVAAAKENQCSARRDAPGTRRSAGAFAEINESANGRVRHAGSGYLLDARSAVLRQQASRARHRPTKFVATTGLSRDTRSEFAASVPVWRDVSERAGATGSGTARPRDQAAG